MLIRMSILIAMYSMWRVHCYLIWTFLWLQPFLLSVRNNVCFWEIGYNKEIDKIVRGIECKKYELADLPPLLNSTQQMNIFPDSPMHLFSGIVKAVIKLSFRALKVCSKLDGFLTSILKCKNKDTILKLNIPWFSIMWILSENFSGMGSNNNIAVGCYENHGTKFEKYTTETSNNFPPNDT